MLNISSLDPGFICKVRDSGWMTLYPSSHRDDGAKQRHSPYPALITRIGSRVIRACLPGCAPAYPRGATCPRDKRAILLWQPSPGRPRPGGSTLDNIAKPPATPPPLIASGTDRKSDV